VALTTALLGLSALVAVSHPTLPARQAAESCAQGDASVTCSGNTWEKLICDASYKVSKCFDATTTCASWNVCDCCSPVPLHKCLSPLAGRAFDTDCSSPIDAREECCGDATTHLRSFAALTQITENVEEQYATVQAAVEAAEARVQEMSADASAAGSAALATARDEAAELGERAQALASRLQTA